MRPRPRHSPKLPNYVVETAEEYDPEPLNGRILAEECSGGSYYPLGITERSPKLLRDEIARRKERTMRTTDQLFKMDNRILCPDCICRVKSQAKVKRIGAKDAVACELCGAKLRLICPHCGNLHIDPRGDIEAQAQWCAEQDRISIEAERIEFFDKWL